ncbi:MAG: helix-turn-helix domain-containing protein [Terracidiphilus sp.]
MEERGLLRERLEREQHYFRIAAQRTQPSAQWLRRIRLGLGLKATKIAQELGVNVSVIFRLEKSEEQKSISVRALAKMAQTMGCELVYAIVPREGKTMAEMVEEQRWREKLLKQGTREQGN